MDHCNIKAKINTIDLDTIVFIDPETSYSNCDSEEPDNTRIWAEDRFCKTPKKMKNVTFFLFEFDPRVRPPQTCAPHHLAVLGYRQSFYLEEIWPLQPRQTLDRWFDGILSIGRRLEIEFLESLDLRTHPQRAAHLLKF